MPTWDELFKREEFRWKRPERRVTEFAQLLREKSFRRVLDLGCGTGRHLVYLASRGFEVHGADIAETGLEYARRWLEQEGLAATLKESDMTDVPYPDRFFDAVISTSVIYHGTLEKMRGAIAEIHRVLRRGGLVLLTFKSKRSHRYGTGRQIEPDTFIHDLGDDSGVPHHYSDREEIEELLREFDLHKIEQIEQVYEGGYRSGSWEVLAEKP